MSEILEKHYTDVYVQELHNTIERLQKQLDFKKKSSASRLEIEQEYASQNRENARALYLELARAAPEALEALKPQLHDITHESDKLMSSAYGLREKKLENDGLRQRIEGLNALLQTYRALLIRTFPLIKDMAIAMLYDDVLGTSVSMGGELPESEDQS